MFPPYYVPEIGTIEGTEAMPDRAHNELLDTLVSAGAIGAVSQLAFFVAVVAGASRVGDPRLRAGVLSAVVVHLSEIQLGIATVPSRLAFMTVVALIAGARTEAAVAHDPDSTPQPVPWWPLVGVASLGALSPVITTVSARLLEGRTAVDADVLTAGSLVVPVVLYVALAAGLFVVARTVATREQLDLPPRLRPIALLAAIPAIFFFSIVPSGADVLAKTGATFEREREWSSAVVVYEQAIRVQPGEDTHRTALARSLIQRSQPLEPDRRDADMDRARQLLEGVQSRNPHDPYAPRNLASLHRIYARAVDEASRPPSLAMADDLYARAVVLAPRTFPQHDGWRQVGRHVRRR